MAAQGRTAEAVRTQPAEVRREARYAVSFLIETLGLAGVAAEHEEVGTNVIYFGDEVVMNGNDICVADVRRPRPRTLHVGSPRPRSTPAALGRVLRRSRASSSSP